MNIISIQGEYELTNGFHYEYDRDSAPLGEGGMGKVFQGYIVENATGKYSPVAIKEIREEVASNPELIERARRESSVQIDDDNLLRMYGFIPNSEVNPVTGAPMIRYYMVMERLVGVDLEHVLTGMTYDKSGVAVQYAQEIYQMYYSDKKQAVITIMSGLLSGLKALHARGYIHRDIDPSNIMITIDRKIKLIDFGISKQIVSWNSSAGGGGTKMGSFLGKVNYAAPELAIGDVPNQGFQTDIYAAGVLLFQLLTGHLPFSGTNQEVLQAQLTKEMPLKEIEDKGFRAIVKKATEKDRNNRYASAEAMLADILALASAKPISHSGDGLKTVVNRPEKKADGPNDSSSSSKLPLVLLYVGAAVIGLAAGVVLNLCL